MLPLVRAAAFVAAAASNRLGTLISQRLIINIIHSRPLHIRELRGGCDIALAWQASGPGIVSQSRKVDGDLFGVGRRIGWLLWSCGIVDWRWRNLFFFKFGFSEKATKFEKIFVFSARSSVLVKKSYYRNFKLKPFNKLFITSGK